MAPSSQQRRRERARARHEAYLQRRARREHSRHRRNRILAALAGTALLVVAGWWAWGQFGPEDTPDDTRPVATGCLPLDVVSVDDPQQFEQPDDILSRGDQATMTLATNCGPIVVDLDTRNAPQNSNSLAFLAGEGFFDQTFCHRLTTDGIYVLQCGDPTTTGSGGPGYSVPDENLPDEAENNYPAGTLAMAEAAGSDAGSQFFLVYEDTTLPPDYSIVGEITDGLEVLRNIADLGVEGGGPDGPPQQAVQLQAVTVDGGAG